MADRDSIACVAAGCERFSWASGMCTKHYFRMRTNGSFELAERRKQHCRHCGTNIPLKLDRAFCKNECRKAFHAKGRCERCDKPFNPRKGRREKFCSKVCSLAILTERAAEKGAIREQERISACVPCVICAKVGSSPGKSTCSQECRYRWELITVTKSNEPSICSICSAQFCRIPGTFWSRRFCSDDCRTESRRRARRKAKKAAGSSPTHRQRARRKGAAYEYINPLRIFDRDGWKCRLCGVSTPKRLRGSCDPRAPELDHIIPFALGGGHLKTNVQCACRQCNGVKGATARGQLHLL